MVMFGKANIMKFKVGDKIRYVGHEGMGPKARQDVGRTGTIVSVGLKPNSSLSNISISDYRLGINLPGSLRGCNSDGVTWRTAHSSVELLGEKQLLFPWGEE